jgi:hypothetical protein
MTERKIQAKLWSDMSNQYSVLLPNYTPRAWYECDLFGISRSGCFHEFEIKLTVADFRKDAKKAGQCSIPNPHYDPDAKVRTRENSWPENYVRANKHERLAARDIHGPSRFWFVMPEGMVSLHEIPAWAGVRWLKINGDYFYQRIARPAPKLHTEAPPRRVMEHALSVCYYRYWHARIEVDKLAARLKVPVEPEPQGVEA